MRVFVTETELRLWASARDTAAWARRPYAQWPCSTLAGHRFYAAFDKNGLVDLTVDGGHPKDLIDSMELSAMCADFLAESGKVPSNHLCRFIAIDQHRKET